MEKVKNSGENALRLEQKKGNMFKSAKDEKVKNQLDSDNNKKK